MTAAPFPSRKTGATASLGRTGFPLVRSETGGELQIVTGAAQPGFNPLDLLYAALSACMAMSLRYAAKQLGVLEALRSVAVVVGGEKASEGPERVTRFDLAVTIEGEIDGQTKAEMIRLAEEEICTISNTLHGQPGFDTRLAE